MQNIEVIIMLRLKEIRNQLNIPQKDVCASLRIPQNTYSQYENGKREPDSDTLSRIADFFDVTVDYLLGRTDEPNPINLDKELEGVRFALYSESEELTDEDKQAVLDFVRFLKSKNKKEE